MNAWPMYRDGQVELIQTSHQQLAIRAAQAGNWKPADSLELAYLHQFVRPHDADGEPCLFSNLVPVAIYRHCGPRGEDVAVWRFTLACTMCAGSGEADDFDGHDCPRCYGEGIDPDDEGVLDTDLDGLLLEDRLP